MVLLIAFWSLKWAKNEGVLCSVHSKASWISKHEESKSWRALKPLPIQSSEQGGESEKESNIHQFRKLPFNLRNFRKFLFQLAKLVRSLYCRTESNKVEGISQVPVLTCEIFLSPCCNLQNHNWRKAILQIPVLTCKIFASPF